MYLFFLEADPTTLQYAFALTNVCGNRLTGNGRQQFQCLLQHFPPVTTDKRNCSYSDPFSRIAWSQLIGWGKKSTLDEMKISKPQCGNTLLRNNQKLEHCKQAVMFSKALHQGGCRLLIFFQAGLCALNAPPPHQCFHSIKPPTANYSCVCSSFSTVFSYHQLAVTMGQSQETAGIEEGMLADEAFESLPC